MQYKTKVCLTLVTLYSQAPISFSKAVNFALIKIVTNMDRRGFFTFSVCSLSDLTIHLSRRKVQL
jgi:hypothetical protein